MNIEYLNYSIPINIINSNNSVKYQMKAFPYGCIYWCHTPNHFANLQAHCFNNHLYKNDCCRMPIKIYSWDDYYFY